MAIKTAYNQVCLGCEYSTLRDGTGYCARQNKLLRDIPEATIYSGECKTGVA